VATITSPANGTSFAADQQDAGGWFKQVDLAGNAVDSEDGELSGNSLVWKTSVNGGPAQTLGVGPKLSVKLYAPGCFGNTHVLSLTASDSHGHLDTKSVSVTVSQFC
jgi:hypothetical protein